MLEASRCVSSSSARARNASLTPRQLAASPREAGSLQAQRLLRDLAKDQTRVDEVTRLASVLWNTGLFSMNQRRMPLLKASLLFRLVDHCHRTVMRDSVQIWWRKSALMRSAEEMCASKMSAEHRSTSAAHGPAVREMAGASTPIGQVICQDPRALAPSVADEAASASNKAAVVAAEAKAEQAAGECAELRAELARVAAAQARAEAAEAAALRLVEELRSELRSELQAARTAHEAAARAEARARELSLQAPAPAHVHQPAAHAAEARAVAAHAPLADHTTASAAAVPAYAPMAASALWALSSGADTPHIGGGSAGGTGGASGGAAAEVSKGGGSQSGEEDLDDLGLSNLSKASLFPAAVVQDGAAAPRTSWDTAGSAPAVSAREGAAGLHQGVGPGVAAQPTKGPTTPLDSDDDGDDDGGLAGLLGFD